MGTRTCTWQMTSGATTSTATKTTNSRTWPARRECPSPAWTDTAIFNGPGDLVSTEMLPETSSPGKTCRSSRHSNFSGTFPPISVNSTSRELRPLAVFDLLFSRDFALFAPILPQNLKNIYNYPIKSPSLFNLNLTQFTVLF